MVKTTILSFLVQRGREKNNLSKFIEDAVKWRELGETIAEARCKFDDLQPDEIDALVADAIADTREGISPKAS